MTNYNEVKSPFTKALCSCETGFNIWLAIIYVRVVRVYLHTNLSFAPAHAITDYMNCSHNICEQVQNSQFWKFQFKLGQLSHYLK